MAGTDAEVLAVSETYLFRSQNQQELETELDVRSNRDGSVKVSAHVLGLDRGGSNDAVFVEQKDEV